MTWILNQANRIAFVMVDGAGNEVSGLGNGFTLQISKNGAAFAASGGTKAEISNGWYTYLATASEADSVGVVAIMVTGTSAIQQNLEYVVGQRTPNAIQFTYTVTNSLSAVPIEGVEVWFSTNSGFTNIVWKGYTDAFGVARDASNNLPLLDPGVYYIRLQKAGYTFTDDSETVS
jgi:hypothetical protein